MTKQADLVRYLFDGRENAVSIEMLEWMEASARFTGFVEIYRDKIRKKIRVARDAESLLDVRCELAAARCLLQDRRFDVAYELYAGAGRRAPDFTATYRENLVLNIEIARLRVMESEAAETGLQRKEERVVGILLDKLAQMQAGMPNLLLIYTRSDVARSIDLAALLHVLQIRIERKDPVVYSLGRYSSPAAFYRGFNRLNGVFLWGGSVQQWVNKQARPPLDEKVMRLAAGLLAAKDGP